MTALLLTEQSPATSSIAFHSSACDAARQITRAYQTGLRRLSGMTWIMMHPSSPTLQMVTIIPERRSPWLGAQTAIRVENVRPKQVVFPLSDWMRMEVDLPVRSQDNQRDLVRVRSQTVLSPSPPFFHPERALHVRRAHVDLDHPWRHRDFEVLIHVLI